MTDHPLSFGIGVWVSQKAENYLAYIENPRSSSIGPFFGWLSNEVGFGDQSSLHLKTKVYFQGDSLRPCIELEPTDHSLAIAQRNGISIDEAWEFVHQTMDS